jgi:copper ion binding protein
LSIPRKRIGGDTMERTATITIDGMSCEHCVRAVKEAIGARSGVKSVDVSLEDKYARVVYDDEHTTLSDLESAIVEEGYEVPQG